MGIATGILQYNIITIHTKSDIMCSLPFRTLVMHMFGIEIFISIVAALVQSNIQWALFSLNFWFIACLLECEERKKKEKVNWNWCEVSKSVGSICRIEKWTFWMMKKEIEIKNIIKFMLTQERTKFQHNVNRIEWCLFSAQCLLILFLIFAQFRKIRKIQYERNVL